MFRTAVSSGQLEMLEWLLSVGCPWNETVCATAAADGDVRVLRWLRQQGCPWDSRCCEGPVLEGDFECLDWALGQGCPAADLCSFAAINGRLEVLQHLREVWACPWGVGTFEAGWRSLHSEESMVPEGLARALLVYVISAGCPLPARLEVPGWVALEVREALADRLRVRMLVAGGVSRVVASLKITRRWLHCYHTPGHPVCRKRLLREFSEWPAPKARRLTGPVSRQALVYTPESPRHGCK